MNLEFGDLRAFVAVAELGSFSAAADDLHLSQPALSRRIAKLEGYLGVRLLERTTRRVDLTAVGRDFARKARNLLNNADETLMGIVDTATRIKGEVTVACVPSAVRRFLPDVLREYHALYPHILVRIVDEGASDALSGIVRNEADFGINYLGAQEAAVDFFPLFKERFIVICKSGHVLAQCPSVKWSELGGYDYLTVTKASGNRFLLDLALADIPNLPVPFCEVRHVRTLVDMVQAGLGIAAVPQLAVPPDAYPSLRCVPLVEPVVTRTLGLTLRRGRVLSPAAEKLLEMIRDHGSGLNPTESLSEAS